MRVNVGHAHRLSGASAHVFNRVYTHAVNSMDLQVTHNAHLVKYMYGTSTDCQADPRWDTILENDSIFFVDFGMAEFRFLDESIIEANYSQCFTV